MKKVAALCCESSHYHERSFMPRKKSPPRRADNRYEVKITVGKDMYGKSLRKSFYSEKSRADAERLAEEWKIAHRASEITGIDNTGDRGVTFGRWATEWLEKYKRGSVRENTFSETYERTVTKILIPAFGNAYLKQIRPADITAFYSRVQETYHESTLKKIKLCLNGIFDTAIDNDLCFKNPAKNTSYTVKLQSGEKHTYTRDEVDTIFEFARTHPNGLQIQILLSLGLRCSEMLGLRWSDFDFERQTVHIQRAIECIRSRPGVGDTKTFKSNRVLPVSSKLLDELRKRKPDSDGYITTTKNGTLYTTIAYSTSKYCTFFKALEKAHPEIPKLTPHELRHTCGTLLYADTKDIFAVSRFLGHSDINITTKIYVHDDVEVLRQSLAIR